MLNDVKSSSNPSTIFLVKLYNYITIVNKNILLFFKKSHQLKDIIKINAYLVQQERFRIYTFARTIFMSKQSEMFKVFSIIKTIIKMISIKFRLYKTYLLEYGNVI